MSTSSPKPNTWCTHSSPSISALRCWNETIHEIGSKCCWLLSIVENYAITSATSGTRLSSNYLATSIVGALSLASHAYCIWRNLCCASSQRRERSDRTIHATIDMKNVRNTASNTILMPRIPRDSCGPGSSCRVVASAYTYDSVTEDKSPPSPNNFPKQGIKPLVHLTIALLPFHLNILVCP